VLYCIAQMSGAIVVIVVESPPPDDPVGTAHRSVASLELAGGASIQTDTSLCGLEPGEPWEMGKWIDIHHPALPETRRRHQVSYVDSGKGFAVYRLNLRFEGDKNRVPGDVSDVAVEIARGWILARRPSAVYITGRRGSPTEAAMASPKSLEDLTWWSWVAGLPPVDSGDGVVTPHADGVIIKLADEFNSKIGLPPSVVPTLGIQKTPQLRLGL